MSQYGQVIDSGIDLNKINVYNYFVNYFNNPILEKIKDVDTYSMYGCRVQGFLSKDKRYIFVLIKTRNAPPQNRVHLDDINWDFLQTRCLEDVYNVPLHKYTAPPENKVISVTRKTDSKYMYSIKDFPNITISLLSTKNQQRVYNDTGTLGLAIESFNMIISFLD